MFKANDIEGTTNEYHHSPPPTASSFDTMDVQLQQARNCNDFAAVAVDGTQQLMNHEKCPTKQWNHKKHILAALLLAPAMFLADWAFNSALATTSVASATVLVSTQSVFVLVLAVFARLEQFSYAKLMGVALTVAGTAVTAMQDQQEQDENNDHAVIGDAMAVFAAVMYACYTVQVRLFCPQNEDLYSMQLLLGYIGLICLVALLPVGIYLLVHVQLTWIIGAVIVVKGMLDFCITDYCLFRAIVLTNATIATVGLGLTIPMAFLADWIVEGIKVSFLSVLGAVAVSIGFLIVNLAPENEDSDKTEKFLEKEDLDHANSAMA